MWRCLRKATWRVQKLQLMVGAIGQGSLHGLVLLICRQWCALQRRLWDLMRQQNSRPLAREWHSSKTLWDAHIKPDVTLHAKDATHTVREID